MRFVVTAVLALFLFPISLRAEDAHADWLKQFAYTPAKFDAQVEDRADRDDWKQVLVKFPSPVTTKVTENNTVHAHIFRPKKAGGAGVIILPIWKGHGLDLEFMIAGRLAKEGITALVMPLPYQFERAPEGHGSGDMTVSADLERTREAVIQAVIDVKRCAQWLVESEGCARERLGVMGTSLGGHVAALVWATDPEFKAGATVLAGGNIHELFWNESNETKDIKAELLKRGMTLDELAKQLKPYDAITYAMPSRKPGLLMIAAKDDTVVPIANVRALRDAFDHPKLIIYPGTHYTVGIRITDILSDLAGHFGRELAAK
ncbi:MAG: alpha/beta hydrolase family protein [Planctomycetes bacterium]|nr:alpha/beta hydrolase family protein [Planctomycetota bacterium]